ncbi:zinc finger CCCH domain-containing protein 11A isoform X2 [Oryzias melastigma]|uniref:zinc finger CCCH domain-containing protein 11A isoform X2 n=1 Tax=Oryzias melastigma TaxID=30732 RepID=UPI000CF7BB0D|nr:zinc finger CCCH domain-containing protein 11A isoform X2 [Oryzias melastigma]
MTNHGDDCYFFYYSTCTKGDSCPFRHCEAAMGNETVCNLWQEGRCFRPTCKFRHMEITKNRKEIPCYWENQPAGCQKPHCAFFHEKPRCIQGLFVPPDQSQSKTEEEQPEDTAAPPPVVLTTSTNPQLRGVIKTDTTEPVPSPTHPPVVINAADDDEDEDEEGEDSRVGPSPRKLPRTGETLTFGVSTLEEIRLRKALMASMRTGYGQKAEGVANGEKENIQAFFRATSSQSRGPPGSEVPVRSKRGVSERLGLRMPQTGGRGREGLPIRKSLAERLGGVIEEPAAPTQEGVKPVKDRLGLFSGPATAAHSGSPAEKNNVSVKDPDQIRIKTLEEIRREKAAKSQKDAPPDVPSDVPAEIPKTVRATRGVKRTVSVKEPPISNIKTFSEIHLAKKKRLEDKQARISKTAEGPVEKPASRTLGESDTPEDGKEVKVRVKTLEEIRREKAARLQAQQDTESVESKDQESLPKKKRLLRVQKLESQNRIETSEDTPTTEKLPKPTKTGSVQVKTFEEIIREKRLRQQEGQASNSTDADGVRPPLKRKLPVQADPASSAPSSPADPPSVSVRKLVPLRSKAASNAQKISFQGRTGDVTETRSSTSPSEDQNQTGSTEQSGESKVRPKLNVKPSVVKLATPLRPAQKKRGAEPSAVAAVKPLNSAAAVQETPQESTCTPPQVLPSPEALLNSAVPRSPTPLQESTLGEEELQTVPVFKQSGGQKAGAAIREACSVPHSPAVKTTAQSRARRTSTTRPTSTSDSTAPAVDDFEELINQFTDDHLEEDVDPGLGEDDLLQELSEMIDS